MPDQTKQRSKPMLGLTGVAGESAGAVALPTVEVTHEILYELANGYSQAVPDSPGMRAHLLETHKRGPRRLVRWQLVTKTVTRTELRSPWVDEEASSAGAA